MDQGGRGPLWGSSLHGAGAVNFMFPQSSVLALQKELERGAGQKLQLKIQDNRSTMLSVKWESDCTRLSLHKMFLQAPENVMDALACYLKEQNPKLHPILKTYIEENLPKLDYSHQINPAKLEVQGRHYHLKELYDALNGEYFAGQLQLHITWFGEKKQKSRTRITFGLYHDLLRLIKINRLLDDPFFPEYLVQYVIFHEMLHHTCPSYIDASGKKQIHSPEFRSCEKHFRYYLQAQKWICEHQADLFGRKLEL